MKNKAKLVLVTGANSGIGRAVVGHLGELGYLVYGACRNKGDLPKDSARVRYIGMDVNDQKEVESAVANIIEAEGKIDVLINNAGISVYGPAEETSVEAAKQQINTNFFGAFYVTKEVLKFMRHRKQGHIINIGSLGGIVPLPFQGFYSASKFALEALTMAIRMEVRNFGIKVCVVHPGNVKTSITSNRIVAKDVNSSAYAKASSVLKLIAEEEEGGVDAKSIAKAIESIILKKNPKPSYRVGPVVERVLVSIITQLPQAWGQWVIRKYYKI